MGTMLQERGLKAGPVPRGAEPDHAGGGGRRAPCILEAGADIIVTNTFGGNREKLSHYGLEDRLREINRGRCAIAREAAGDAAYVAGSIGPTGSFVEPVGDLSFDEMAAHVPRAGRQA